jgi:hypothetical protein
MWRSSAFPCGELDVESQTGPICNGIDRYTRRRVIIAATAALGEQLIDVRLNAAHSQEEKTGDARMVDIPLSPDTKVAVKRRGQIVLIAINRPQMFNRIDPETFYRLAKAYYDFDNDPRSGRLSSLVTANSSPAGTMSTPFQLLSKAERLSH